MAAIYLIFLTSKAAQILSILYKFTHIIRCKLMGRLCFLLAIFSVIEFYKRVLLSILGFFVMDCASSLKILMNNCNDFGCGFLISGCFSRVFNVLVLLVLFFILGFKFLHFRVKSSEFRTSKMVKNSSFECGSTKMKRVLCKNCGDQKFEENNEVVEEFGSEDEVFDVMSLRKMVKTERRKASALQIELEKERMAASSSVDEAMAMILRLQNEKSVLQIRANQLERVAQEKQSHDQDVIQSLQWIIMKHESERSLLEEQLNICRDKLRVYMKGDEWDQFECACRSTFETVDDDMVIRALDLDSSVM
ncbi:hypothetical protein RND81_14G198500 [Saponaria officinalis]|uniref:GTD-binding domain-containing protein n=1 Tax=Saponaria officinalis TaxID=3572 RepID=A0AAW1GSL7_SAPOF